MEQWCYSKQQRERVVWNKHLLPEVIRDGRLPNQPHVGFVINTANTDNEQTLRKNAIRSLNKHCL